MLERSRESADGLRREMRQVAIDGGRPMVGIGTVNAISARIAAETGFDALWVSGLELSAALGLPDENLLNSQDLVATVLALRRSAALPVIVDIDNAGSTVAGARRLAFDLTSAGAAAVTLEDSSYPKVNSFSNGRKQRLADPGGTCSQLKAMRDEVGQELVLIARTEALVCGYGISEAMARASAFVEAGADAVLVHSTDPSATETLAFAAGWTGKTPLVTVPTAFPQLSVTEIGAAGFALAIYANQLSRAAMTAMRVAVQEFSQTGCFLGSAARLADLRDLFWVPRLSI